MVVVVYVLGSLTTLLCAVLLLRRYSQVRVRLLLWAGLCFAGLTVNNATVFVDRVILPTTTDLYPIRLVITVIAMAFLLVGLIWDSE